MHKIAYSVPLPSRQRTNSMELEDSCLNDGSSEARIGP